MDGRHARGKTFPPACAEVRVQLSKADPHLKNARHDELGDCRLMLIGIRDWHAWRHLGGGGEVEPGPGDLEQFQVGHVRPGHRGAPANGHIRLACLATERFNRVSRRVPKIDGPAVRCVFAHKIDAGRRDGALDQNCRHVCSGGFCVWLHLRCRPSSSASRWTRSVVGLNWRASDTRKQASCEAVACARQQVQNCSAEGFCIHPPIRVGDQSSGSSETSDHKN